MLELFLGVCASQILWKFVPDCRTTHAETVAAKTVDCTCGTMRFLACDIKDVVVFLCFMLSFIASHVFDIVITVLFHCDTFLTLTWPQYLWGVKITDEVKYDAKEVSRVHLEV